MKKQLLPLAIVFLSATAVFTSCKKDNDETSFSPAKESCYITSSKDNGTLDSAVVAYDADNRLSQINYYDKDNNSVGSETYTYSGNQLIQKLYDKTNKLTDEYHHVFNSDGTIRYTDYMDTYESTSYYDTTYYLYENGYNIQQIENRINYNNGTQTSQYSDTSWYTYTGGNVVSQKEQRNGKVITTTYTYYDLEDKNNVFSGQMLLQGVYGKSNKNLVKSGSSDDSSNNTSAFTYRVNEKGLVTNYVSTYTSNTGTDTFDFDFFYTCK